MRLSILILFVSFFLIRCNDSQTTRSKQPPTTHSKVFESPTFTLDEANTLLELPLHCIENQYPNKLGQTIGSKEDLQEPKTLHPIFYGCFDWHSAVHGYWSIVTLLDRFPAMERADEALALLKQNITPENVAGEIAYFKEPNNTSFERTYGWAWLLKLQEALHTWQHPDAQMLAKTLQPLSNLIVERYKEFLPKLVYPIRTGEHPNTAFGLSFAYDYAVTIQDEAFKTLIANRAKDYYLPDTQCPITWEPSGFDFLSPCLEEVNLMRRVLTPNEFTNWLATFMPEISNAHYHLEPGKVSDRKDGKLVHLDGLNFSRAWVFYGLANQYPAYSHLKNVANEHIAYSYPNLVGDSYEGGHWLGSFAIYALTQQQY